MSYTVRPATTADFPALVQLINRVFKPEQEAFFENYLPNLYTSATAATESAVLAFMGEQMVGHVGIYPLTFRTPRATFKVGGIGAVASAPEARGQGIMGELLEAAIRMMEDLGYDLSVLWGDRRRYRNYGWDYAGGGIRWQWDSASHDQLPPAVPMRPAVWPDDAAQVAAAWNSVPLGTVQTEASIQRLALRPQWQKLVAADGRPVTIWYQNRGPAEAGHLQVSVAAGKYDDVAGALRYVAEHLLPAKAQLWIESPGRDHPLAELAGHYARNFEIFTPPQYRIINPRRVGLKLGVDVDALTAAPVLGLPYLFGGPCRTELPREAGALAQATPCPLWIEHPAQV